MFVQFIFKTGDIGLPAQRMIQGVPRNMMVGE